MKDAFDQWWEWANKVPLGMDPTGEKPCQREEETKPTRLAEIRQMLDDYAKRPASHHQEASPQAQLSAVGWTNRSIRQQIIVPAQNSLDVNRRSRGGIGICRASCEHTERPVIFIVLCNAIDRYFLHVMTAGLLSHFLQRPTLQIRH